jgi:hypothetical protein
VTPPTEEEVAAIVAAVEMLWPRPSPPEEPSGPPPWRFSGRWWSLPAAIGRERPWVGKRQ